MNAPPIAEPSVVSLAEALPQIVWTAGTDGGVTYLNRRWQECTGLSADESLGFGFVAALHPSDRARTLARWERAWRDGEEYEIEYRLSSRSGGYRWYLARGTAVRDASGTVVGWAGTCTDIDAHKRFEEEVRRHAAELKASRAELAHLARHDRLTGLPNRALFEDRLQHALTTAHRHGQLVAVFFIDLDGFKRVNDTLGHAAGDALLREVAGRLERGLRGSDTVARLGGDEFAALASDLDRPDDALPLARKLLAHVSQPCDIGGHRVKVTGSVGVSIYPRDADDASSLLRHADVAMYRAKRGGKNDTRFFAPDMNVVARDRLLVATHLDGALERGEFALVYQPQWDVRSRRCRSFEALLRWKSPVLGDVAPSRFIPVAEDNGVIAEVTDWVLGEVCHRAAAWSRLAGTEVRLAMNASLPELERDDFVSRVADAFGRHGLAPGQLELELTNRGGSVDVRGAPAPMRALRELGVRLTLDDFGAANSSIDHALHLPLDGLKIDQEVVRQVEGQPGGESERVLQALVSLARALDLEVVADGIEAEEQRARAVELHCGRLQGFLIGRPAPEEAAGDLLHAAVRAG